MCYGRTGITGYSTISATSSDLGGPVKNSSSSFAGDKISLTAAAEFTTVTDFGDATNFTVAVVDTPTIANGNLRLWIPTNPTQGAFVRETLRNGADGGFNTIPVCPTGSSTKTANRTTDVADELEAASERGIVSSVYPNPASNVLNFNVAFEGTGELNLFDLNGRVVATQMVQGQTGVITLDISNVHAGVYFYQLRTNNSAATGKIIVE